MSGKPVWIEDWTCDDGRSVWRRSEDGAAVCVRLSQSDDQGPDRARLISAAPALVRTLLIVEWAGLDGQVQEGMCSCCSGYESDKVHDSYCELDAALTLSGFPDQVSRDEARRLVYENSSRRREVK